MPSQSMRSAVKQVTKLHESLSPVLPEAHIEVSLFQNFICTFPLIFGGKSLLIVVIKKD